MCVSLEVSLKYFLRITVSLPINVFMVIPVNTVPSRPICQRITRSIYSGMANVLLNGPKKLAPALPLLLSQFLPPIKIEQQGYKSCMGLLKLADKYSINRLEAACQRALSYTPHPSYKSVKNILTTGQDKLPPNKPSGKENRSTLDAYGYTRGADYYGR